MISFEITNASDNLLIGTYKFGQNNIIFSNHKNELTFINEANFAPFELKVLEDNSLVVNTLSSSPILLDKKKLIGKCHLNLQTKIQSGSVQLKLLSIEYSKPISSIEEIFSQLKTR